MEELKLLANVLKQQRVRDIGNQLNDESKIQKFEELLVMDEISDDKDACLKIYGDLYETKKYRILKHRVKERLYNRLF